ARLTLEAISARDWDAVRRHFHPDAEWHNTRDFPGPAVCRGIDEIVEFWRNLFDSFTGAMELERVKAEDGLVIHGIRSLSAGKASGVPIDVSWAVAYRVRDGLVVRADVFGGFDRAAKALGLAPG